MDNSDNEKRDKGLFFNGFGFQNAQPTTHFSLRQAAPLIPEKCVHGLRLGRKYDNPLAVMELRMALESGSESRRECT